MSVFLLKTEHGSAYLPPACTPLFNDVPCPSLYAAWIEQLFNEGITGGCGGGNYCPDNSSTRGQMAVFLDKIMGLPGPPPPTVTPTPTPVTPTLTPAITNTFTKTFTFTADPTITLTFTPTTGIPTVTLTPTKTFTFTNTATFTNTFTKTFSNTATNTKTCTFTNTATNTPTPNPNVHIVFVGPGGGTSFVDSVSGTTVSTITAGQTIEWQWQTGSHTSTNLGNARQTAYPRRGGTRDCTVTGFVFDFPFPTVGTYPYYCAVHGVMMTGIINVLPVPPPTFTPTP